MTESSRQEIYLGAAVAGVAVVIAAVFAEVWTEGFSGVLPLVLTIGLGAITARTVYMLARLDVEESVAAPAATEPAPVASPDLPSPSAEEVTAHPQSPRTVEHLPPPPAPEARTDWAFDTRRSGVVEAFSLPKIGETPESCEDAFAYRVESGLFALSDGASTSFEARHWARLLCDGFVESPPAALSRDDVHTWLTKLSGQWRHSNSEGTSDWFNEAAASRGAFATLLGVQLLPSSSPGRMAWQATAVGDSCLIQVRDGALLASFPIEPGGDFGAHPSLLATRDPRPSDVARFRWAVGELEPGDVLLLLSDALAEWALTDEAGRRFIATAPVDEIEQQVATIRSHGQIVNDDLTLVRVAIPQSSLEPWDATGVASSRPTSIA